MAKRRTSAARPSASKRPAKPAPPSGDEAAFVESLIANGQAAKRRPDGSLPPGATHELIEDENGEKRVVRRRFSAL
ncbi:MAG TPA: hypothetical protein VFD36_13770 [Kofleriaceae bacterium]|jgi:hypothetical protein|nr:hypothetical protein [Kofleriaceae bacterium]